MVGRLLRLLLALLLPPGCAALLDREAVGLLRAVRGEAPEGPAPRRERGHGSDLWRPGEGAPRAAIVLAPGFSETGRDDPRLWPVARGLAAAGLLVMVPDLPGARRLTLDPADTEAMAAAAAALAAHPENPRPGAVAMTAVSYAAGPALLAAARPGSPVALLLTIGGYHDMTATATAAATGAFRAPGEVGWRRGPRNPLAAGAFLLAVGEALTDPGDRWYTREAARRLLAPGAAAVDDLGDLAVGMTAEGHAALALATESDPDLVPARIAALPARARAVLAALDPARRDLSGLPACVVALHGEADPVVPWTEALALARAVPRARLVLVPGFGHIGMGEIPLAGKLRLIEAARALLDWRDGRDPCG